jgi:hypothetical protein
MAMQPRRELTLDERLRAYLAAPEADADVALEDLISKGVRPLGSAILRAKLRISLRPDDDSHLNQMGLDMLSDVVVDLLAAIKELRTSAAPHISNFQGYVTTAVLNAYRQYLRAKYPERLSLRNKIRYILLKRLRLDLWLGAGGDRLCGSKELRDDHREPISANELLSIKEHFDTRTAPVSHDDHRNLIRTVEALIDRAGAPMRFEDLVTLVWILTGGAETTILSDDAGLLANVPSAMHDVATQYDVEESIRRLWEAVKTIPLDHRRALLLNLTDGRGENLIAFLPGLGIASIRDIAQTLEFDLREFVEIWVRLPLEDMAIAEMLGITRQQVINLRQTARAKLRRICK